MAGDSPRAFIQSGPPEPQRVAVAAAEQWFGRALLTGTFVATVLAFGPDARIIRYAWPWVAVWDGLLALAVVAFVAGAAARRPVPRLGAALDLGLFLWAATTCVSAWLSPFRWQSMHAALLPLATVSLAYAVRGWLGFDATLSRERARDAFAVVGTVGVIFIAASLGYWFVLDLVPLWLEGVSARGWSAVANARPLGRASDTAGLVLLMLPILATLAATSRRGPRVFWGSCTIAGLLVLATTQHASAWLALIAAAIVTGLLMGRMGWRSKLVLLVAAAAVFAALIMISPPVRQSWERGSSELALTAGANDRAYALRSAWLLGRERPVIGWGPATADWARVDGIPSAPSGEHELAGVPLLFWVEYGGLGAIALFALSAGVVLRAWRLRPHGAAAQSGTRHDRAHAWAIVYALSAYAMFELGHQPPELPVVAGVLAALLALLSALTRPVELSNVTWSPTFVRVVPAAMMAGAWLVVVVHTWSNLRARSAFAGGMTAWEHGEGPAALKGIDAAQRQARGEPFYWNQRALLLFEEMKRSSDATLRVELRSRAIEALRESARIRSGQDFVALNLGWLLLESGDATAADGQFRACARIAPRTRGVYFALGLALLHQEREAEALRAFALEWINNPSAVTWGEWYGENLVERRHRVLAVAQRLLGEIAGVSSEETAARAAYLHALLAWWLDPTPAKGQRVAVTALTDEQQEFFAAVHAEVPPAAGDALAPWARLLRAWHASGSNLELASLPSQWLPWQAEFARRIVALRESFAEFLTAPPGSNLVEARHPVREHYGEFMRNTDGLPAVEWVEFEENLLVGLLPSEIFPAAGWLGDESLLSLVATLPD